MDYPLQFRRLYRRILRELPLRPSGTKLSAPSPLQLQIRESLIAPAAAGEDAAMQVARLEQFVQYARAQRSYLELVERYNPGMNMSDEERVKLSARRVGMNLPVDYEKE